MPGSAPVGHHVCRPGSRGGRTRTPVVRVRSSDIATLLVAFGPAEHPNPSVHGELIRLSAGYLDRGKRTRRYPDAMGAS